MPDGQTLLDDGFGIDISCYNKSMRVNENILISSLTTMRLGGPARYVLEVETPEEVADAYGFAETYHLPTFVLGYGANSIGRDEGFPGVIIINRMRGITVITNGSTSTSDADRGTSKMFSEGKILGDNRRQDPSREIGRDPSQITIKIMGGENWDDVVNFACERNLTGIEALSKIPGLAGAAPVQNIGAYGQEISDCLTEIEVYDSLTKTFKTLKKAELNFSYRKSILNTTEKNRYFVISITLELKKGEIPRPFYNSIESYIDEYNLTDFSPKGIREIVSNIRAEKLPDPKKIASAGSFFKNIYLNEEEAEAAENKGYPVHRGKNGNKISSAWLIEKAGLKNQVFYGFRISDTAPLVLINEAAKSYEDLKKARSEIIGKVYDEFGYWLEQEPVEIV